jgi:hypothetical protein
MVMTQFGFILYCILTAVVIFGALVSLSGTPGIRGYRNIALLLAYVLGIVSFFTVPLSTATIVWVVAGIVVGLCYAVYELWSQSRSTNDGPNSGFQFGHLIYGLFAWPLMFMEIVENIYAELKGQKSGSTKNAS